MDGGVLARRLLAGQPVQGAAGRDFGGSRFRSTPVIRASDRAGDQVGPRQNVSDQPVQVLIQPESLILAQSERWRQA